MHMYICICLYMCVNVLLEPFQSHLRLKTMLRIVCMKTKLSQAQFAVIVNRTENQITPFLVLPRLSFTAYKHMYVWMCGWVVCASMWKYVSEAFPPLAGPKRNTSFTALWLLLSSYQQHCHKMCNLFRITQIVSVFIKSVMKWENNISTWCW